MSRHRSYFQSLIRWGRFAAIFALALILSGGMPLWAVINPRFTPVDLIRGHAQILRLTLAKPAGGKVVAAIQETLRGQAMTVKEITFTLSTKPESFVEEGAILKCLAGQAATDAILLLNPPGDAQKEKPDEPVGCIQINALWFAVVQSGKDFTIATDDKTLFSVWAGNAANLAEAVRWTEKEYAIDFPVCSDIRWIADVNLGKFPVKPVRSISADLGEGIGSCVVVLSPEGDRILQVPADNPKLVDITKSTNLNTRSQRVAFADIDGDGKLDLVSYDGAALFLAPRGAAGTFGATIKLLDLPKGLSLDVLELGTKTAGLIVGTANGPVLVSQTGGAWTAQPFVKPAGDLGGGGYCSVADFDGDGRVDVLTVYEKGLAMYSSEAPGKFRAPVTTLIPLVQSPSSSLAGDFNTDGKLDLLVGGLDGLALLSRDRQNVWQSQIHITGELAYHGNQGQPKILDISAADINGDSKLGLSLFYPDRKQLSFFNRGFACLGWARELDPAGGAEGGAPPADGAEAAKVLPGQIALQNGQSAGSMIDANRDGAPDLFAVAAESSEAFILLGGRSDANVLKSVVMTLPITNRGPTTVTVKQKERTIGMFVVRPGQPATLIRPQAGPVQLSWTAADGSPVQKMVPVIKAGVQVEVK